MNIVFIYRKKNPLFYSIEKVFSDISFFLQQQKIEYSNYLVHHNVGLLSVFKNIFQIKKTAFKGIVHITGDIHYVALVLPSNRTVLTIHDLGFIKNSKGVKKFILKKIWIDWPIKKLQYITVISEATKNELLNISNCAAHKIHVIHNPISAIYQPSIKEFDAHCPVILHIGITTNKNLERTILALQEIKCQLVIIGKINDAILDLLQQTKLNYINKENLTDEALYNEYKNCDIVSFCSLLEGFGLPIIEAQAVGRVVLTSNLEPMLSVASKEGAFFINPYEIDDMKKGFQSIIENKGLRDQLVQNGLQNVKRFTIEKIGSDYLELYKKMEQNNSSKKQ